VESLSEEALSEEALSVVVKKHLADVSARRFAAGIEPLCIRCIDAIIPDIVQDLQVQAEKNKLALSVERSS